MRRSEKEKARRYDRAFSGVSGERYARSASMMITFFDRPPRRLSSSSRSLSTSTGNRTVLATDGSGIGVYLLHGRRGRFVFVGPGEDRLSELVPLHDDGDEPADVKKRHAEPVVFDQPIIMSELHDHSEARHAPGNGFDDPIGPRAVPAEVAIAERAAVSPDRLCRLPHCAFSAADNQNLSPVYHQEHIVPCWGRHQLETHFTV